MSVYGSSWWSCRNSWQDLSPRSDQQPTHLLADSLLKPLGVRQIRVHRGMVRPLARHGLCQQKPLQRSDARRALALINHRECRSRRSRKHLALRLGTPAPERALMVWVWSHSVRA